MIVFLPFTILHREPQHLLRALFVLAQRGAAHPLLRWGCRTFWGSRVSPVSVVWHRKRYRLTSHTLRLRRRVLLVAAVLHLACRSRPYLENRSMGDFSYRAASLSLHPRAKESSAKKPPARSGCRRPVLRPPATTELRLPVLVEYRER